MKILVVDDSPTNIDLLCEVLEGEGYEFFFAVNGEEAIRLTPKVIPDLILMDVMMPGIDGFETAKKIKQIPESADIPILFLTAKIEMEDMLKGFASGGADYIVKPFCKEEVCARIHVHLELRRLNQLLTKKNEQLEILNDTKNKLLGMAAHDLRNPLSAIEGFARFMLKKGDDMDPEVRQDFLQTICDSSSDLIFLLNDLLDVSAIESGSIRMNYEKGEFDALVEKKVSTYRILVAEKEIQLRLKMDPIPSFVFSCERIGQVLDNLLSNAVKYSPKGGEVFVTLVEKDDNVRFTIRDQGVGILAEDRDQLFKPFGKLKARPTGGESSSGLGLAIAANLIRAHGGKIWEEGQAGQGAVFIFEIPMQR
ncbi:MAG: hypothetical protein COV66_14690 [Nitrospinae bacterium CG11_big_fil_rev_8_21_14_0_20_45_15]|nr:MAG: hypothetical protein COV66_14690 [Nitrospinae bacterium CG11_big_fil_rev_8_21_14_0_20_45_15]